jgi:hypothetical protein
VLEGAPIVYADDAAKVCTHEQAPIGCGDAIRCDALQPSRRFDLTGKEWIVLSPCVPAGWTAAPGRADLAECVGCRTLSVAECASAPYCATYGAQPIDQRRQCLLASADVACDEADLCHDTHRRRVVEPSGAEWVTAGNCVPGGWGDSISRDVITDDCPALPDGGATGDGGAVSCAGLSAEACGATTDCRVVRGMRVDDARHCLQPFEFAGCAINVGVDGGPAPTCAAGVMYATAPGGQTWRIVNACIPDGWTAAPSQSLGLCPGADGGSAGGR